MTLHDILVYTGYLFLFINILIYFKSCKNQNAAFKIFLLYLIGSLTLQIYSTFVKKYLGQHNLFISHYFFIGKFILLSLFFMQILKKSAIKKLVTILLYTILVLLILNISFFNYNYASFNVFEIVITSFPLIIYCFLFFVQKIEGSDGKYTYLVSGMFIYFLCSLLLFSVGNLTSSIKNFIWHFNAVLYIVYQVIIFIEWQKNFRKKNISTVNELYK